MIEEEEEDSLFDQSELLIHNKRQTHGKVQWKKKGLKTVALSLAFFCVGLCIAIPGPTLLELGRRVHRDTEHMTFIFTARSVGFLIGSLVGGVLFDFFDQQILLFYTLSLVAVATVGVPWCTALLSLSALICVQGVAIGVLDTGGNVFCIKIWGKRSAPFMQVLHFAFGIGAFLAPLIARPFLFDTDTSHNSTLGSYHPVKFKVRSVGSHPLTQDSFGLNYLNHDYNFLKSHSDYNGKILNNTTGQNAAGTETSGFSANWDTNHLYKNEISLNQQYSAMFEYGRFPGFMKFRMKRDSSGNQTVIGQKTNRENETEVVANNAEVKVESTVKLSQATTRAKKPDVNNGDALSKDHADAEIINSKIIDLKKNAPQSNVDTQKVTPLVPVPTDGQNTTARVMINGSHVSNSTGSASVPWTGHVSTGQASKLEPGSSILPTTVVVDVSDSTTTAARPAEGVRASGPGTSRVTPAPSSFTPTPSKMTTATANITIATTGREAPTVANATTTAATLTTAAAPTSSRETTSAAPASSSETTSPAANSTKASSNTTASITTNKSTAAKPETTGDLLQDVVNKLAGMSKIQFAYTVIGLLLTVNAGLFLFLHCKDQSLKSPQFTPHSRDLTRNPLSAYFVASVILLLFFFFLAYMGMEATFGGLLMTFAVEYSASPLTLSEGATLTALFWGCLAFGRGCSICIARYLKPSRMMMMNLGLTMFGALILSFSIPVNPAALWVGTVTLGLGMSSLFPTAVSWADSCYPLSGRATAVFVAGCGVGEMTVPVLTGYLYEVKNKMSVMYMMLFLSCLLSTLYVTIQVLVYQKVKSVHRKSTSGFMRLQNIEQPDDDSDLGIAEGINLGLTETMWRRKLQGEEERGKETSESSKFTEVTKLIEM
ncbi:unnamed protein product [Candidula unifasciata]|uniref:Sodium-dependent glucose transporter 1 n=1 Tax=Candidula unifasciata TaxID=100452 RepID=A0A8S3YKS8_9EUPU|nr:unnamed protein product [Candidula unifasciata]